MISKSVTRRTLLKSGTAAAAIGLASPFIISPARAKADHTLTFGHTFGKATESVMITGLDHFKKKAEQYAGAEMLHEIGTPESLVLSEELEAVIHAAINELPQELKTAVTLREFEGLSYEDIAVVMECPVGTVRSRIFRAREAIDTAVRPLLGSQRGDKG